MVELTEEDFPLRSGDTIPDNAFQGSKAITKLYQLSVRYNLEN